MRTKLFIVFLIVGTQAGSPMPPRPPSQQLEGQNQHMTQATMATQGK